MTDNEIRTYALEYACRIAETDVYRKYCYEKDRIKKQPDLYEKVNEYRALTFQLQNNTDQDQLFDKLDEYEREYEKFRENPVVESFLQAELGFCRLMQELNNLVMEQLDFE